MRVQQEVTGRGWPYTVIRRAKSDLCIRVGSARLRRPSVSLSIIYIYAISNTNILPQILGSLPSGCRRIRFELSPTTTTTAHTKVFKSGRWYHRRSNMVAETALGAPRTAAPGAQRGESAAAREGCPVSTAPWAQPAGLHVGRAAGRLEVEGERKRVAEPGLP